MKKVAAIQMCSSANVNENLKNAGALLRKAADLGALLAVLPENFALMGLKNTDKLAIQESFGQGLIQDFLSEQAQKNKLWIVGGTIPIIGKTPNHVRAACIVYNAEGKAVARYDKIHLFDVELSDSEKHLESETIEPGEEIVVVNTPVGKLGLAVCYDVRFPELFIHLAKKGAEIIVLPSAFTMTTGKAHWEILTRCRAIENFSYLIGAGQTGTHENGRETFGHTLIVEPWGGIAAMLSNEIGVITADVDLTGLSNIRKKIPVEKHRKKLSANSSRSERLAKHLRHAPHFMVGIIKRHWRQAHNIRFSKIRDNS